MAPESPERGAGPPVRNFDWGGQTFSRGDNLSQTQLISYFLVKYVYFHCELNYNSSNSQEIVGLPLHYSSSSVKTTFFNRYEDTVWPPQCHNFDSTAGAGGFTAGATAPAVNMLEEALKGRHDVFCPSQSSQKAFICFESEFGSIQKIVG